MRFCHQSVGVAGFFCVAKQQPGVPPPKILSVISEIEDMEEKTGGWKVVYGWYPFRHTICQTDILVA
eukprot:6445581-Amphidinium_carterae.1